jgi:hypothetical protein
MLGDVKQAPTELEVGEDHRIVREMAYGIVGALSKGGGVEDLRDRVVALVERVRTHFTSEEALWERDRGWKDDPTSARWVEGLVREHRGFEERMKGLIADLRSDQGVRAVSRTIESRIRTLIEELFVHEFSETKLFQRRIFEES